MPVLANAKHERMAQGLAQGKSATEAHHSAGYQRNDGNASKLAGRADLQARVKEITGEAAAKVGIGIQQVFDELVKLGFANMLDYMQVGPDGQPYTDFSKLTADQAAAIQYVHVETVPAIEDDDGATVRPEIKKVTFKLADKRAALVDLGKHLGMFKQKIEHTGPNGGPIETVARVILVPPKEKL